MDEKKDMHDDDMMKKMEYTCPMHPEVKKDQAGMCPICGMTLVPVDDKMKSMPKDN